MLSALIPHRKYLVIGLKLRSGFSEFDFHFQGRLVYLSNSNAVSPSYNSGLAATRYNQAVVFLNSLSKVAKPEGTISFGFCGAKASEGIAIPNTANSSKTLHNRIDKGKGLLDISLDLPVSRWVNRKILVSLYSSNISFAYGSISFGVLSL